jgi:photosystem II stability/assembly factor-like uncharacterized protein
MSWNSLASNQTVSFNNLQDAVNNGVFTLKNTLPVPSTQQVTSGEADYYVNVIPTDKAATQLVVKSNLVPLTTTTTTTIACYRYEVCADDGTGDKNSYPFTYVNCEGTSSSGDIVNLDCREVCAAIGSVDSTSGFVFITELGTCATTTTTTTTAYVLVGSSTPFTTLAVSRGTGQYQLAGNSNFNSNPWTQGFVFRSNDYGVNWFRTSLYGFWDNVATSDDGQYMLAVEYYGKAYRSSNYGESWTQINNFPFPSINNPYGFSALQTLSFRGAALSLDGQFQVICTAEDFYGRITISGSVIESYYNTIFVSNNYGVTWTANYTELNQDGAFNAVAISANGQIVVAARGRSVIGFGDVLRSTNNGVNWSQVSPSVPGNLVDIAILADGSQAIAARFSNDYFPYLLASTNSGATWNNVTGGGLNAQQQWQRVSISINGAADAFALPNTNSSVKPKYRVPFLSTVILHTPLGSKRWKAVANSNNGQYILLGTTAGLWRSSDQGATWSQVP